MLAALQSQADAVAMAAAVADLRLADGPQVQKTSKDCLLASLATGLELVPDLLAELVGNRPEGQVVLGFAALTGDDAEVQKLGAAKRLLKGCDLLFANPIDRPGQGFEENANGGWLVGADGIARALPVTSKLVLAHQLLDALLEIPKTSSAAF